MYAVSVSFQPLPKHLGTRFSPTSRLKQRYNSALLASLRFIAVTDSPLIIEETKPQRRQERRD